MIPLQMRQALAMLCLKSIMGIQSMSANIAARFRRIFEANSERVCLQRPGSRDWTYRDLHQSMGQYANALRSLGVQAGDRIVVQVDKSPEAMALYLGCLEVGGIYVPLNTGYTTDEVAYFVGDADPTVFISGTEGKLGPINMTIDSSGSGSLVDLANSQNTESAAVSLEGQDLAAILYTSGTTGRSKGAMLSHDNLMSNAETLIDYWAWQDDDVLLHALPIYHVHGLFVASHCVFLTGTTMIFLPSFNPKEIIEHTKKSTVLMGVPTFYTRLLQYSEFDRQLTEHMRLFISGSAPLTEQTFKLFEEKTDHRILERYGMSETGMIASNPYEGDRLPGTVGYALPDVEVRIANEDGAILEPETIGGIEVRGPNVFSGYWRMPEKTAQEFREDGFFMTGDMGVMNIDGRVSIVGREKDLVISGGLNVYPKEVELLLDTLEGVTESAVIGVPHSDFGEAVVAVVVGSPSINLAKVDKYLENKLARFKQPKAIYLLDELPRNAMGKIQKNLLRKKYAETFKD